MVLKLFKHSKNFYQKMATDEVFSTKFYWYGTSTNPKGEKMNDSVGMEAIPSTEESKNRDDFANRSAFSTMDCNFIIDDILCILRQDFKEKTNKYKHQYCTIYFIWYDDVMRAIIINRY